MSGHWETAGKFYWPSDHYSIPADNLCWHVPPAPNRDFRCIREAGHPGKHKYEWSPKVKDHSHKAAQTIEPEGCHVCNGDCAGANPPVVFCPMRSTS